MGPMKRLIAVLYLVGSLAPLDAQPPEADQALRSRVTAFYQAHVDGKPRRAEALVAEDSKDVFFEQAKPRYYGFSIQKISYSDGFQRAEVTVDCEEDVTIAGMGRTFRTKVPRLTRWKVENGEWFWYFDPDAVTETPFGLLKPGGLAPDGSKAPLTIPQGPSVQDLMKAVKADKAEVTLSAAKPSVETVTVTNGMPGWVTLRLQKPDLAGLEAELDRTQLQVNQTAKLTLRYKPQPGAGAPAPARIQMLVEPTGVILPVRIIFQQ